ncbi:MAG: protein-L-isoaspartate O-methyltransferase [Candidatus Thermoplasmatota archaeon]|nr:protein-L-isoaspartate O-methyltransferase [Candidatus Thermoplasmatota archaeon]
MKEEEMNYELRRAKLVKHLIRWGYLKTPEIIEAISVVPRHLFVPERVRAQAYEDYPLEIGLGQTISAPHMVAIMLESLELRKGHKVLEIGTGLGYHSAVASVVVGEKGKIYTVERYSELAEQANKNLEIAGIKNVEVVVGDGSRGLEQFAPYDRIFATCGAPKIPSPLIEQLKENSKLLLPIGSRYMQDLILVEKINNKIKTTNLGGCMFVPMIGEYGYKE